MPSRSDNVPSRRLQTGRTQAPPARRPARRHGGPNGQGLLYGGLVVLIGAVAVIVLTIRAQDSKGLDHHQAAINYGLPNGVKVYGGLGPEGVPVELGPILAPPDAGLTGATIDGIACGATEQLAYHHHVHLAVFVDGKPYSVPIGIGMVAPIEYADASKTFAAGSGKCLYWTHVHAQDGIVHIESPYVQNFTLGQIMDVWGVTLSSTGVGRYTGPVTATVDGTTWSGDLRQIPLTEHAEIVVNVGTPVQTVPPISWRGTGL